MLNKRAVFLIWNVLHYFELRNKLKISIENRVFFVSGPPSGLLPVLGPLERYRLLHLMRPCLVALRRVLIWVELWIVETSKACNINPRRNRVFCHWNCDKVFPLLNEWYTILRWDSIHRSPRHSFNWMWTNALTNQAGWIENSVMLRSFKI